MDLRCERELTAYVTNLARRDEDLEAYPAVGEMVDSKQPPQATAGETRASASFAEAAKQAGVSDEP